MMTQANSNEVNVVFGATGGSGQALCRILSERGSKLFVVARDARKAADMATDTNASHASIDSLSPDVFEERIKAAKSELGQATGVVNWVGLLLLKPGHRMFAADPNVERTPCVDFTT